MNAGIANAASSIRPTIGMITDTSPINPPTATGQSPVPSRWRNFAETKKGPPASATGGSLQDSPVDQFLEPLFSVKETVFQVIDHLRFAQQHPDDPAGQLEFDDVPFGDSVAGSDVFVTMFPFPHRAGLLLFHQQQRFIEFADQVRGLENLPKLTIWNSTWEPWCKTSGADVNLIPKSGLETWDTLAGRRRKSNNASESTPTPSHIRRPPSIEYPLESCRFLCAHGARMFQIVVVLCSPRRN